MSGAAKTEAPWITGFCGNRMPAHSHRRCPQTWQGRACSCPCHQTCPTCGQPVPPAIARQETRP